MADLLREFWGVIPTVVSIVLLLKLVAKDSNIKIIDMSNMKVEIANLKEQLTEVKHTSAAELHRIEAKLDSIINILVKAGKN